MVWSLCFGSQISYSDFAGVLLSAAFGLGGRGGGEGEKRRGEEGEKERKKLGNPLLRVTIYTNEYCTLF